jgi:FkbM family methyltransferase
LRFLKDLVRRTTRKVGHEIRKFPSVSFSAAPVFDMAVQLLMATRGERVKFIQVGANDGKFGDPLRKYILKYPWHGILVEPQPDVFVKLCENYAPFADQLKFENVAIAEGQTTIAMYRLASGAKSGVSDGTYRSSVVSACADVTARQLGIRPRDLERFLVPCTTLDDLIIKHHATDLDILQIDTEGYDWQVLKTLKFSNARPAIIQFEHGHLSHRDIDHAVRFLNSCAYRIFWGGWQSDTIALRSDFVEG